MRSDCFFSWLILLFPLQMSPYFQFHLHSWQKWLTQELLAPLTWATSGSMSNTSMTCFFYVALTFGFYFTWNNYHPALRIPWLSHSLPALMRLYYMLSSSSCIPHLSRSWSLSCLPSLKFECMTIIILLQMFACASLWHTRLGSGREGIMYVPTMSLAHSRCSINGVE